MTDIKMPQLGESIVEGTVARWLKRVGDQVAQYEALLEVTTDKVDTEVPAPAAGLLTEILVPEGSTVRVGTVLARLGSSIGTPQTVAPPIPPTASAEPHHTESLSVTPVPVTPPATPVATGRSHPPISPVVAKLVAEHQLDLRLIRGSGSGGRVSKQDVLRYLANRSTAGETAPATAPLPLPALTRPVPAAGQDEELLPLTAMRRAIAEHMQHSAKAAPQATTIFEIDMGRVVAQREQAKAEFARQGVRLTITAYILQAVAQALQHLPLLNGRYTETGIVLNKRVHLGVAVALDQGLIVPVIRDAAEKNLLGLARSLADLSERARARKLTADETQGGTFTVSNHGVGGSVFATPIINQPQAAILGVGAIVRRPVVIVRDGIEAIAIRPISYFSLTFDHRVCDGAEADAFMSAIKRRLEG